MRALVVFISVTLGWCASAQSLDFEGPEVPPVEEWAGRERLVAFFEASLEAELRRLAPPSDEDEPEALPRPEELVPMVRLELRRLGLVLAQRDGPTFGRDLLWARTVGKHLDAFDDVSSEPVARALRDLVVATPSEDDLDRALREAFAPLLSQPIPRASGWVLTDGVDAEAPIDAIDADAPPHAHAALAAARNLTDDRVPVQLAGPARALRFRAAAALELYRPVPDWFARDLADRHSIALFNSIAETALGDPTAHARLDRLDSISRVIRALDDLPASRSTRDARVFAIDAIVEAIESGDGVAVTEALDAATRLANVLKATEPRADRDDLIRQLRPAWPRLLDQRRRARGRLADVLPRVLAMPRPQSDPAFLAMLADAERAEARIEGIARLSFTLCGGVLPEPPRRPVPIDRYDDVADRVLDVIREMPDRREGENPLLPDRSEILLARLFSDARRLVPTSLGNAPERAMVADLESYSGRRASWARISLNAENEFLDQLRSRRTAWLSLWNKPAPRGLAGSRQADRHATWIALAHRWLGLARPAVELAEARSALRRGERCRSDAWPGWAMNERVCEALLRPYEADLARAAVALRRDELSAARAALDDVENDHALARLAGEIELELPAPDPSRGALAVALDELAAGPADPSLSRFGPVRDAIAEACVWAYEVEASRSRDEFEAVANHTARRALRRLELR
ncbi:MAG: hypothetical protein AAGI53_06680 [Planctomycetota bacterium]